MVVKEPDGAAVPGAVMLFALAALLVFAALFLGASRRPLPMMIAELAALAVLVSVFLPWRAPMNLAAPVGAGLGRPLSKPLQIFLILLLLVPLIQLLPVTAGLWAELPGRAFYAESIRLANGSSSGLDWRAMSLIPSATEAAWLALLPPLAVFVAAMRLDRERLLMLVLVFLGIATLQALLGLAQYGSAAQTDSALGTYLNRNHLAGLLEMALPVSLALLAATVGHTRPPHAAGRHGRRKRTFRQWVARFSVTRINQAAALGAVSLAILLGLIFTRSRAGVTLAMVGILLSTLMFSYRLGGRNTYGLIGTFTAVGVGVASLIGLVPVLSRFTYADPFEDGRWKIFDGTVRAIGEFFPLGSGAGTFVEVLRRFHPASFPGVTINRAHNDYLEWLLEFGLIAGVLILVWLLFYVRQWGRVWKRGDWTIWRFAQAGAGIALLLMMLHTLVDYNLRTPANAVATALVAAVFFHRTRSDDGRRYRKQTGSGAGAVAPQQDYRIPPENQSNPFGA